MKKYRSQNCFLSSCSCLVTMLILFFVHSTPLAAQQEDIPPFLKQFIEKAGQKLAADEAEVDAELEQEVEGIEIEEEEEATEENDVESDPDAMMADETDMPQEEEVADQPPMPPVQAEPSPTTPSKTKEQEIVGPETVAYSAEEIGIQGNWRKKKEWLAQAVEKNDEIQAILSDIHTFRKTFLENEKKIDNEREKFSQKTGFDKGETKNIFQDVVKYIEKTKENTKRLFTIALSQLDSASKEQAAKIREQYIDTYNIEETFKKQQNKLEQVELDFKTIDNLDKALRERLQAVNKQAKTINTKADRAQQIHGKIWHVIDDQKAKDLFYELAGIYEQIKATQTYIKSTLANDFNKLIDTLRNQIKKTNTDIQKLEDDGIFIINRTKRVEEKRNQLLALIKKERAQTKTEQTKREKVPTKRMSWFATIIAAIKDFFITLFF